MKIKFQLPKLKNTYYVPGYKGFVPGMKSENPFAKSASRLSSDKIKEFERKQRKFTIENNINDLRE